LILNRRKALSLGIQSLMTGSLALGAVEARAGSPFSKDDPHLPKGNTILFQGDSITDGGRWRSDDPNHILGQDYAYLIAAHCGGRYPEQNWKFLNRGVSGNTVVDLAARWNTDTLALKPDILSILVGINDAASILNGAPNPVTVDRYAEIYAQILAQTHAALPQVRFVLCEPFTLPVGHTASNFAAWQGEIAKQAAVIKQLAHQYQAPVVHLQPVLDAACHRAPADYWIWDGIHPTYAGHQLLMDEWLKTVNGAF
jgi:lysophospholipase L1-like esterase